MLKLLLKALYVGTLVRHRGVEKKYRYYIRDNSFCHFYQLKYYFRDFVYKKQYKRIGYKGEFQQELTFILPFAYWHFLNGTLDKTISSHGTKELYFFSSNHQEAYNKREAIYNSESYEIPNMTHTLKLNKLKWAQVPLKHHYKNELFVFAKPILIVANKYNVEWDDRPLNYLDIQTLNKIFNRFTKSYQVIYNRPLPTSIVADNSETLHLNEHQWIRDNHPEVILLDDLYCKNQTLVNNFNHLQLMVYANCNHFISVHGGTAAFASYFGGINIILSKSGIEHIFNEFHTIFPSLSGAKILHAKSDEELLKFSDEYFTVTDNDLAGDKDQTLTTTIEIYNQRSVATAERRL